MRRLVTAAGKLGIIEMSLPLSLGVAMLLAGWLGADLDLRRDCLEVSYVWPDGPAGTVGLKHGDCLRSLSINNKLLPPGYALEGIVSAGDGEVLRAQGSNGNQITITLTVPTRATLVSYCDWRQRRRVKIEAVWFAGSKALIRELVFDDPPAIREVRERVGALGEPRVKAKGECGSRAVKPIGRVSEALAIAVDATITFGEPAPDMVVMQDDGGTCSLPAPSYLSDGGVDFRKLETVCAPAAGSPLDH